MDNQTQPTKMSAAEKIAALFISPAELMDNIKFRPAALMPLIICVALTFLYLPLLRRYTDIAFEASIPLLMETYENMGMANPGALIEQAQSMMHTTTLVTNLIGLLVSVLFSSLGMLLLTKIFKGDATFGQYFSMYSFLLIIGTLGTVAVMAISVATNNQANLLSLGALLPSEDITSILNTMLTSLSLPNLWVTALAVVGLKVINEWTTKKAIAVGATSFVLSIAAGLALQIIPSMLMGG